MTTARLTLIAAVGRNRAIGSGGDMPWHLPEDLAFFKRTTVGHTLVMGRRTWDSIGRALPGRRTIVVTRQQDWAPLPGQADHSDVAAASSLEGAIAMARDNPTLGSEVFIAGGGEIYAQALPLADRLLLTEIDQDPVAEVFFPEVDPGEWREVSREDLGGFAFVTYERR